MAASKPITTAVLTMKLLIDSKSRRVLYAEAGKEVVDFLFSLLAFPLGAVTKLLTTGAMVGSVGNLYGSVEKLDDTYVQPGAARDALLRPKIVWPVVSTDGFLYRLLPSAFKPARSMKFFRCSSSIIHHSLFGHGPYGCLDSNPCGNYVTDTCGMTCPSCRNLMNKEVEFLSSHRSEQTVEAAAGGSPNGFVQGVVTYTVTGDLKVAPISTISGITLLKTFGITDIGVLVEKTVQLGYAEGPEILRVSLQSKTALSDVFLGKKQAV